VVRGPQFEKRCSMVSSTHTLLRRSGLEPSAVKNSITTFRIACTPQNPPFCIATVLNACDWSISDPPEDDSVTIRSVRQKTLAGAIFNSEGKNDTLLLYINLLSYINPRHSTTSTSRPCKSVDKISSPIVHFMLKYNSLKRKYCT